MAISGDRIVFAGSEQQAELAGIDAETAMDAMNRVVMPGFVDCHTHSVFGGSREDEFLMRLKGKTYLEILKDGGGILSTVRRTRNSSQEDLLSQLITVLDTMLAHGTTTAEIKTGYGLSFPEEMKLIRVIQAAKQSHCIDIITTYMGAHALPQESSRQEYVRQLTENMHSIKGNAEFWDVFCEKSAFTPEETRQILETAKKQGFKIKVHADQLSDSGGAALAASIGATSADHIDFISETGINALAESETIAVLLPGPQFFLMAEKSAPARRMVERGVKLAIATDFNPGTCPCPNMQLIIALACINMKLTPAEAINCATINAAFAAGKLAA